MIINPVTREEWLEYDEGDSFAKHFVARCDDDDLWDDVFGLFVDNVLVGSHVTVIEDDLANLKLLHVFPSQRGKDYGYRLLNHSFYYGNTYASYFKVTSEKEAVKFYEKAGYKICGKHNYGPYYLILGKYKNGVLDYNKDER